MNFITGFLLLMDWKNNNNDLTLVIIDCLTKLVHYKAVKITINIIRLVKIIINVLVGYYYFLELIVSNKSSLFTSKFWFLLCYYLDINQKLSIAFYLQINSQIKK